MVDSCQALARSSDETKPDGTTVSQSISPQTTSAIMREKRIALRRSRTTRDQQSTRHDRQRGANSNSKEFLAALCGQEIKDEEITTESEDEGKELSKSKPTKPKK